MAEKIYKLFITEAKEAMYQLSDEEQHALFHKLKETQQACGGKRVLHCHSRWSGERHDSFGIEEFPEIEAVQKYAVMLEDMNWFRYVESETYLGTEWTD